MIKKYTYKKNNYRSLIKVILPSLLFLVVLFSLFSISNNTKVITSLSKVFYGDNEIELDNWEISTVFYDSTVDNGNTPLTEINWNIDTTDYNHSETRVITVQINYKNTNTMNNYAPGEVKIKIPNIAYQLANYQQYVTNDGKLTLNDVNVSANDTNHVGYDWDFDYESTNAPKVKTIGVSQDNLVFKNAISFEKNSNFEGAIQISYTLESHKEDEWYLMPSEAVYDECEETSERAGKASLITNTNTVLAESNDFSFYYYRKYIHPWEKRPLELQKTAEVLQNVDNLELDDSYYWVKYYFIHKNSFDSNSNNSSASNHFYPRNGVYYKDIRVVDQFPEECIVYNVNGNLLEPNDEIGTYYLEYNNSNDSVYKNGSHVFSVIVGYPKSIYNAENNNLEITNVASEYGKYARESNYTYFGDSSLTINLTDYEIAYPGALYNYVKKNKNGTNSMNPYSMYYQNIISERAYNSTTWNMPVTAYYLGKPMTVVVGDDLLYYTNNNNEIERLGDNDYYFTDAVIPILANANSQTISNRYAYEVWVRKAGNSDYEIYKIGVYSGYTTTSFSKADKVVGWYIKIKDLHESLVPGVSHPSYQNFKTTVVLSKKDIANTGQIYNVGYLQVYNQDSNGNLVLANESNSSAYTELLATQHIAEYDINTYGKYLQRSYAIDGWKNYNAVNISNSINSVAQISEAKQDESRQVFFGDYTIFASPQHSHSVTSTEFDNFYESYLDNDLNYINGFSFSTLLPEGMYLDTNLDALYEKMYPAYYSYDYKQIKTDDYDYTVIYDKTGRKLTKAEIKELLKNHTEIEVEYNYDNTKRNKITVNVDISDNPLIYVHGTSGYSTDTCGKAYGMALAIPYYIPYDSLEEHGEVWNVTTTSNYLYQNTTHNSTSSDEATLVINDISGVHEDLSTMVQSINGAYDVGLVRTGVSSEYIYKLRARNGNNDVTNLVIYDSLEKYAKDPNMEFIDASKGYNSWKGSFLGIDTSYAESKGYTVRTYYSESDQPGSIKDDDSWVLYTDSVDKTKVKSLAFEYLDNEGNPAVLPANSLTYVLIRMKSPSDENLKTLAYNGCWTEWNAIDSITGRPVDFITGINSNIVKVALPNSVEPQDIDLEINKYWKDKNNSLGIRPETINIQVIPDGDLTKAIDVPLGTTNIDPSNSNHWKTTISVPKTDLDGNIIAYTIREDETILDNGYKYTPEVNDNSITNTLMKEIELKKIWKDNTNAYLTRPSNVTYKIKQNNNLYREVTFTGDYSTNEWTKKIIVPVYDNSNRTYNYTIEENQIDNYTSNCSNYTCTNTLTGNDTLNIKKNWIDNNNSYNTRPSSIMINVLQNNTTYRGITLTSNNNWTNTITVPKYDSNGVKYHYTIEEEQINEYDLVEYNQNNYTVTNTLKTNINLTITKNWIDDNNSNNTRPNELKITLLQNNNEYKELTLSGDTNTWTTTIEVPKYDNNQKEYKYSIREITDNLNSDYSDITYSGEELSVTNKLNKKQDLIIKKKWIDEDNKYLTRPNSININLLRDNEIYRTITLTGENNTWITTINDIDVYDLNGRKYNYTLEEETLEKYGKVTYNNADLEITNELTEIPKVTLYFTVVNGYVDPITKEIKYDDFGLDEIMKKYNVNPEDEYIFKFELQNIKTGKIYDGKLSTKGILEFDDLPYGEYKAVEGEDKLFKFVDMLEIEEVNGVKFEKRGNEGFITIKPTGENIIYGAKIINKIEAPIVNPKTHMKGLFLVLTIILVTVLSFIIVRKRKELYN